MIKEKYDNKTIFMMSLPIFVELLLQLLVGNIDQFMISKYSQEAVAAIGNGNQIMNIVIVVLNVMSVSTTILISQYLGAKNKSKGSEVSTASLLISSVFSILITILVILFNKQLFMWLKVPNEILAETSRYTVIIASFVLIQGIYMTINSILRSYALMKEVMYVSILMNMINIIGNAILINGLFKAPRLGIVGAAISTNFSKCIGLIAVTIILIKKVDIKISLKYLKPFPIDTIKKLLFIGLPSGGESLSYNLSQMIILKVVNIFGTSVIATRVYGNMLANVCYVYSLAIGQATQVVIGYLIGAGREDEVENRVWSVSVISLVVSLAVTILIYFNSDAVFGIFSKDPVVLALGKKIIFIEIFLEIGRAINIVMTKCLIAAGDVYYPVLTTLTFSWVVAVGGSYILGVKLGLGLQGVWLAMMMDELIRAVIFAIRFKSCKWKNKSMIETSQVV
ncbi:MAG: MATE family efflux transporter [Terrisporobacter sp.]|uniref:MATE family efflux transporter n=1 Tax=Terrisporobacter sp. TaxID=1965305 RepID=UPI0039A23503